MTWNVPASQGRRQNTLMILAGDDDSNRVDAGDRRVRVVNEEVIWRPAPAGVAGAGYLAAWGIWMGDCSYITAGCRERAPVAVSQGSCIGRSLSHAAIHG